MRGALGDDVETRLLEEIRYKLSARPARWRSQAPPSGATRCGRSVVSPVAILPICCSISRSSPKVIAFSTTSGPSFGLSPRFDGSAGADADA